MVRKGGEKFRILDFEVEAFFHQTLIAGGVELEELGGPVGAVLTGFVQGEEELEAEDFFAEIAFVEFGGEDGFVEALELREGELFRQKFESDGLIAELGPESCQGGGQDFRVVEREGRGRGGGEPLGVRGVGGGSGGVVREVHERIVGDADDAFAWVTFYGSEGVELFQENLTESGFLVQFAGDSLVEGFVLVHKSAWEGPLAFEGSQASLDEEDFEFPGIQAEDRGIHGQGGSGILIRVGHGG